MVQPRAYWHTLLVLLLVAAARPVRAQTTPSVERVRAAYERLDYEAAEAAADSVLAGYDRVAPGELAEAHTFLALIAFNEGQPSEARRHFRAALSLAPGLSLDPLLVSPKARKLFEEVRAEVETEEPPEEETAALRYVVQPDPRPDAALRSMVVPGWGQFYLREPVKGGVFLGLWTGALAGAGAAHLLRAGAEKAYLDVQEPHSPAMEERYDAFARWHRVRNGLLAGAAVVWVVSYVDVLYGDPRGAHRVGLFGHGQVGVRLRF